MAGFFAVNFPTSDSLTGMFTFNALKPGGSYAIPRAFIIPRSDLDNPAYLQAIKDPSLTMLRPAPRPYIATDLIPESRKGGANPIGIDAAGVQSPSLQIDPFSGSQQAYAAQDQTALSGQNDILQCNAMLASREARTAELRALLDASLGYYADLFPGETIADGCCMDVTSNGMGGKRLVYGVCAANNRANCDSQKPACQWMPGPACPK